jgi:hypothetical protein
LHRGSLDCFACLGIAQEKAVQDAQTVRNPTAAPSPTLPLGGANLRTIEDNGRLAASLAYVVRQLEERARGESR